MPHGYDRVRQTLPSPLTNSFKRLQLARRRMLPFTVLVYCLIYERINVLKPTGHVMHQQFNIQQLYALLKLYLCVLYLPENKQRLVPFTS
jgi:hypothetical protein